MLFSRNVFIGYRRDDTADAAGRLYDWLARSYGESHVFKDVNSLAAGSDFARAITSTLRKCDVFIALIGPHWLEARDERGNVRLHDTDDYVRRELETAFRYRLRVIPVLINGARMPAFERLPIELRELSRLHALELRRDPDFRSDVRVVVASVKGKKRAAPVVGRADNYIVALGAPGAGATTFRSHLLRFLMKSGEYFTDVRHDGVDGGRNTRAMVSNWAKDWEHGRFPERTAMGPASELAFDVSTARRPERTTRVNVVEWAGEYLTYFADQGRLHNAMQNAEFLTALIANPFNKLAIALVVNGSSDTDADSSFSKFLSYLLQVGFREHAVRGRLQMTVVVADPESARRRLARSGPFDDENLGSSFVRRFLPRTYRELTDLKGVDAVVMTFSVGDVVSPDTAAAFIRSPNFDDARRYTERVLRFFEK